MSECYSSKFESNLFILMA